MQRVHNVDKWQEVPEGNTVNFGKKEPRRVRLDLNAPNPVTLFHSTGDGEVTFVGRVVGRDVIELFTNGEFALTAEGGPIWLFTIDGEDVSFEESTAPILTKIAERRPRNPEFELMQYHANRNMELRMEQMRQELDRAWDKRISALSAPAVKPAPKSGGKPAKQEPAPTDEVDGKSDDAGASDDVSGSGAAKK